MASTLYATKKQAPSLPKTSDSTLSSLISSIVSKHQGYISSSKQEGNISSSLASYQECVICLETFLPTTTFPNSKTESCNHWTCQGCIRSYFNSVLKDTRYNASYENVQCPESGCEKNFNTSEFLPTILSKKEINDWWCAALSKTHIANKVTCPMDDCKAIFDANIKDVKQCTFTECYECHRGFCMACQEKWHPGVIKIVNDKEALKRTLKHAEKNNWSRCPKCFQFVEKINGCLDIACHCGAHFCYRCGGTMREHNVCAQGCNLFTETKLASVRESMFVIKKGDIA
ncbi:hypothetical protein BD770DRAFT_414929 [Pilaira anomala]|nr:hypothetical protein BD770DRAFT_414929 [Pilaira anomala]